MALTDNLRGCWSPSLGPTGVAIIDRTPFARHFTGQNMLQFSPTAIDGGRNWKATQGDWAFDITAASGTANNVIEAKVPPTEFANNLTVTQWVRLRTVGSNASRLNILYWCDTNTSTPFLWIYNNNNQTVAYYWSGNAGANYAAGADWALVSVTWQANDFRFFVNGLKVFSGTLNQTNARSGARLYLGEAGATTNCSWGETAVWNRTLSDAEIALLYRMKNGAIGRRLTGQTRRRRYGFIPPTFRAAWIQRAKLIGGGV